MHSAQIAKVKTGAGLALVNPIFIVSYLLCYNTGAQNACIRNKKIKFTAEKCGLNVVMSM